MGKHFCIQKIEEDIFCLDLQYADLRRQATRRWPHSFRLQHSEGVDPPPRPPTPWWCQEAQEEGLHHTQEDQAQAQEDQVGCSQILQGRWGWQDRATWTRMPDQGVWCWCFHGCHAQPTILRSLPLDLRF